jgi:hypothetical protein
MFTLDGAEMQHSPRPENNVRPVMATDDDPTIAEFMDQINPILQGKDYLQGIKIALREYEHAKCGGTNNLELLYLSFLSYAAKKLSESHEKPKIEPPPGQRPCSFCYEKVDLAKNKLVFGADVAICKDCIELAHDALKSRT